ncbi:MAG: hypothetical protein FWE34_02480 [Defluviitaleaceae bacterium]|nr:hypothetical protein [Defluviitaleaceae bacterium]
MLIFEAIAWGVTKFISRFCTVYKYEARIVRVYYRGDLATSEQHHLSGYQIDFKRGYDVTFYLFSRDKYKKVFVPKSSWRFGSKGEGILYLRGSIFLGFEPKELHSLDESV